MKIFAINLERCADRRMTLEKRLNELGLQPTFLCAVDGKTLSRQNLALGPGAMSMSDSEIACYLSHIQAWQAVVDCAAPAALILEDDVEISPQLPSALPRLQALSPHFDALRLASIMPVRGQVLGHLLPEIACVLPRKNISGTMGYCLSAKGAQRLLATYAPPKALINMPIDDALDRYWQHNLVVLALKPDLIWQGRNIETTIEHTQSVCRERQFFALRWVYSLKRRLYVTRLYRQLRHSLETSLL